MGRDPVGFKMLRKSATYGIAIGQQVVEIVLYHRPAICGISRLEWQGKRQRPPLLIRQPFLEVGQRVGAGRRIPVADRDTIQPDMQPLGMRTPPHATNAPSSWTAASLWKALLHCPSLT